MLLAFSVDANKIFFSSCYFGYSILLQYDSIACLEDLESMRDELLICMMAMKESRQWNEANRAISGILIVQHILTPYRHEDLLYA